MPVQSPSGKLLEKWLAVDMSALHALSKNHPDEAQELIDRMRAAVMRIRPDLFEQRGTEEK